MKPKMRLLATLLAFVMIFGLLSPVSLVSADGEPTVEGTDIHEESSQGGEPAATEQEPTDSITEPTTPDPTIPFTASSLEGEEGEPDVPTPTVAEPSEPTEAATLPEPTPGEGEEEENEPLPTESIPEIITITFDADGGSAVAPVDLSTGSTLSPWPVSTRPYQFFQGWSVIQGGALLTEDHIFTQSQTLFAVWEPNDRPGTRNNEWGQEGPYDVFMNYSSPLGFFGGVMAMRRMGFTSTPTINVDHPTTPGQVMLFKEATLVPGMVNTWDVKLRIEAMDTQETADIVLVIDRSGSMAGAAIDNAKIAATSFVNTLLPAGGSTLNRVGIVSYSDSVSYPAAIGSTKSQLLAAINGLSANGFTFTQGGIRQGIVALDATSYAADHQHLVLLSDGVPNRSYKLIASDSVRQAGYYALSGNRYGTGASYARSDWHNTTVVGSGADIINQFIETYNGRSAYYDHGNSSINEASFAKNKLYTVWTIGYNLASAPDAQAVLNGVASPGRAYTATTTNINTVLSQIAGEINSAVKDAVVIDPMASGFQIPAASIASITATQGAHTYVGNVLNWTPGTLSTPISTGSNVKYAEITYRVEINDDILAETPDEDDLYPTNDGAILNYKDSSNKPQSAVFPVPLVNPVFYQIEKVLLNAAGDDISSGSTLAFTVDVTGPTGSGYAAAHTISLPGGSTGLLTTLRYQGTYNVVESAVSSGDLSDYEISYAVNGVPSTAKQFVVADDETPDISVAVTNQEETLGAITVTKVFNNVPPPIAPRFAPLALTPLEFTIALIRTDVSPEVEIARVDLQAGQSHTFDNLPYGTYRVEELTTGYLTAYNPSGGIVTLTRAQKTASVTVTNTALRQISVTGTKVWTGDASTTRPTIHLQLLRSSQGGTAVAVAGADIKEIVHPDSTATWYDLPEYDPAGYIYTYSVHEVDASGNDFIPEGYVKTEDGLTVTNHRATVSWTPEALKVFNAGGRALADEEFTFELRDADDHVIGTAKNDASGAIEFHSIRYDQDDIGKTFTYTMQEVIPSPVESGITYDTVPILIRVTVSDAGGLTPELTVQTTGEKTDFVFTNGYTARATWAPHATKSVTGRALANGEFSFQLFKDGSHIQTVTNDGDGNINFSTLAFNQNDIGKTYSFTIKELVPATPEPGMTYDPRTITIPVSISFADGEFKVTVAEPEDLSFSNTYEASGSWIPHVQKSLIGRPLTAGYFEFALYQGATLLETVSNDAAGNVVFSAIDYDQDDVGTVFEYSIKEVVPSPQEFGVTYDLRTMAITVEVTDLGRGVLAATATYPDDATFVNRYVATGTWTPTVLKELVGRTLAAEEFEFALFKDGAYVETVTNDALNVVYFSAIYYDQTDIGQTYEYTIKEVVPAIPETGMTYDSRVLTITVNVGDAGDGRLSIETIYPDDVSFVNTYEASGSWIPRATKEIRGRALENNEFAFDLLEDGNFVETAHNDAAGDITFAAIGYDASDIGKEFTYTIREFEPLVREVGVTYDPAEIIISVKIEDAGDGVLRVIATYPEDMTFNNAYEAYGEWLPSGEKILHGGGRLLGEHEFSFELASYEPDIDDYLFVGEYDNADDGSINFEAIPFDQWDAGRTFTYRIRELVGTEAGMTYATNIVYVDLTVEHGEPGEMIVTPFYYEREEVEPGVVTNVPLEAAIFENRYEASGEWTPDLHKVLVGRDLREEEFMFFMDVEGHPGIRVGLNHADGTISFEPLTFSEDDIGKTYTYWIYEAMPDAPEGGMTYDDMTVVYEVTISDAGDGNLLITATEPEDTTFNNRYEAENSITIDVTKELVGRTLTAGEFEFVLLDEDDNVIETVTNAIDGTVAFTPLHFTEAAIGDVFRYKVREVPGTETGMTYATEEVLITIDVADAGGGVLEIGISYTGERHFVNTYKATGSITPEGLKDFDSWQALVADQFSFELLDAEHNLLATYGHDADGNIRFAPLEFTEADIGKTFTYYVREIPGANPHILYDPYELSFEVSVADAGAGELAISIAYPETGLIFYNYEDDPLPLTIDPSVEKRVDGTGAPSDAPFVFELRALTPGAPMPAGSVGAVLRHTLVGAGSFHFGEIAFLPEAGTYRYEVVEVRGDTAGFTYDETVFTIDAVVAWDGDAYEFVLTTDTKVAARAVEAIVFTNHFKATPPPDVPKTGEATRSLPWLGLLFLGGAAFLVITRRKKKAR